MLPAAEIGPLFRADVLAKSWQAKAGQLPFGNGLRLMRLLRNWDHEAGEFGK